MTTFYALGSLAQQDDIKDRFTELIEDPVLVVASVLLIVVSIGWIVVARLITRNMRRAALRRKRRKGPTRPNFTMWDDPP